MTTALATKDDALTVTPEQFELIKRTVANGATPDELKLYLFDCARQGVHPLDKLIHFTKRAGKYTPITSIDFMRIRAAETNEYAGSDDATFEMELQQNGAPDHAKPPRSSHVTVWRFVQGQRCPFSATARWSEYCPPSGQDHMWRKMPHTMLAKCAEALALRKGFPRQLAGLYAKEEMDQAGPSNGGYTVEAPAGAAPTPAAVGIPSKPNGGDSDSRPSGAEVLEGAARPSGSNLPEGAVLILNLKPGFGRAKGFLKHSGQPGGADGIAIYDDKLKAFAEQCCQDRTLVRVQTKVSAAGKPYVTGLTRVSSDAELDAELAAQARADEAGRVF